MTPRQQGATEELYALSSFINGLPDSDTVKAAYLNEYKAIYELATGWTAVFSGSQIQHEMDLLGSDLFNAYGVNPLDQDSQVDPGTNMPLTVGSTDQDIALGTDTSAKLDLAAGDVASAAGDDYSATKGLVSSAITDAESVAKYAGILLVVLVIVIGLTIIFATKNSKAFSLGKFKWKAK